MHNIIPKGRVPIQIMYLLTIWIAHRKRSLGDGHLAKEIEIELGKS